MKKILIATDKPFAKSAVDQIKSIFDNVGYETIMLEKYTSQDEFIKAVSDIDGLIIRSDNADQAVLSAGKNLKIVVRAGAGYDNIDLEAATKHGVVAMNTPGQNSNAVAELVLAMMVYAARNKFNGTSGTELRGKALGIHAYGNVGKYVAKIAQGFGMKVYAFDPFVSEDAMIKDGVTPVKAIEELYKCQYVSLHIPATSETKKSIGYKLLSNMPKKGILINTARKEVIDEESLLKFMAEREDFCYFSDIAPDSPDFQSKFADRVFFTPKKMGAQTSEANINAGVAAANQIVDFFEKGITKFQVNR